MILRRKCEHGVSFADACPQCEDASVSRHGIDCPRCGDEFDGRRCTRAANSDLCLTCAVELDPPSVPDFVAYDINESPSYRDAMIDAGRSNLLR